VKLGWDESDTSGVGYGRQETQVICRSTGGRHVLITIVKA